jgi:hypothetical protein
MRLPDGLPFVRLGQVPYLHIPSAKAWIEIRIHRPNPVRAARADAITRRLAVSQPRKPPANATPPQLRAALHFSGAGATTPAPSRLRRQVDAAV